MSSETYVVVLFHLAWRSCPLHQMQGIMATYGNCYFSDLKGISVYVWRGTTSKSRSFFPIPSSIIVTHVSKNRLASYTPSFASLSMLYSRRYAMRPTVISLQILLHPRSMDKYAIDREGHLYFQLWFSRCRFGRRFH